MSEVLSSLTQRFPGATTAWASFRDQERVIVSREKVFEILKTLRDDFHFDMLVDVTAVDYLEYEGARDRFGLVYCLLDTDSGKRLVVKTMLNEPDIEVPSVTSLWSGADWMEREVFDMFGIRFAGHPNLKRILLPDEFTSFPLRKDYPVQGRGERHNFPVITRAES